MFSNPTQLMGNEDSPCFKKIRALLLSILFAMLWTIPSSCSHQEEPDQIAHAFIEKAEMAFENRSGRQLKSLISSAYRDSRGRSEHDITALGSTYIMRARSIHVFFNLESARRNGDSIEASVLVALASRPIEDRSLLPQFDGDIYIFEIVLAKDKGEWKLLGAEWRQAMLDDLVGEG
jgi:hypothetical protein